VDGRTHQHDAREEHGRQEENGPLTMVSLQHGWARKESNASIRLPKVHSQCKEGGGRMCHQNVQPVLGLERVSVEGSRP
jgi:hypothetical protein